MKTKTCSTCKQTKNTKEFVRNKSRKDGLSHRCKSCVKSHYQANKDKIAQYKKAYYRANKDKIDKQVKASYQANKKKRLEYAKTYLRQRKKNDPIFKLKTIYRSRLRWAFNSIGKKKSCSTLKLLGLNNYKEFADYLSNQFYDHPVTGEKMAFDNHGVGRNCWQIDHIIPLLTANNKKDIIKLSHYTNLQPLWHVDHVRKTTIDKKNR